MALPKLEYRSLVLVLVMGIVVLNAITIRDAILSGIRDTFADLFMLNMYLFCYLGWKKRILLLNFFWALFYFNLQLLVNSNLGIHLLEAHTIFRIREFIFIMMSFSLVMMILGLVKHPFRYISDAMSFPVGKILWISLLFTAFFQLTARLILL
jgi:hypothetical protein